MWGAVHAEKHNAPADGQRFVTDKGMQSHVLENKLARSLMHDCIAQPGWASMSQAARCGYRAKPLAAQPNDQSTINF